MSAHIDNVVFPEELQDDPAFGERQFRDSVHEYIPISARVCKFIDTEHFQRLKKVKQLGTSYFVWPGASHNRFEHCLGVAHLARELVTRLKHTQPNLGITSRDIECVQLAGLCHDLGHGPWSHVWDGIFIPAAMPGTTWKHEDASDMMFDDLVKQNDISISDKDRNFIKALIAGDPKRCSPDEKLFLFEIVANKRNGIDVDKFDYIARDNYHIGERSDNTWLRLIQSARVIDNQICWDAKEAGHVYGVCHTRFMLHKQYYSHKTARAIEYMIVDALLAAEKHLKIAERIFDPRRFVYLTDSIMDRIQESTEPELADSRAIFKRVVTRDLYKLVDYNVFEWEYYKSLKSSVTPESIVRAAKVTYTSTGLGLLNLQDPKDKELADNLQPVHVIVDLSRLHYGMGKENPPSKVGFCSIKHNQYARVELKDVQFMTIWPSHFGEVALRVYTRDRRYHGVIQAGFRALMSSLDFLPTSPDQEIAPLSTPPALDAYATPRTASLASIGDVPNGPSTPKLVAGRSLPGSAGPGDGSAGARKTPFTPNQIMTIMPRHGPASPTQQGRKVSGVKRERGDEDEAPPSRRRAS